MKRLFSILVVAILGLAQNVFAQNGVRASYKTDINIISVNDMHAAIDNMPKMAAIVDSLRAMDKSLMVISAGDNRTGSPVNDMYSDASFPMIALMNQMGFTCSAFGNHEFDSGLEGLARNINESAFPYICANIFADPQLGIQCEPYKFFNVKGVKICILGVVEAEFNGIPSTHPNNVKGIRFAPAEETIRKASTRHRIFANLFIVPLLKNSIPPFALCVRITGWRFARYFMFGSGNERS